MMSDTEVREVLQKLTDRVGQVETEVRVLKHDFNNMAMTWQGLDRKLEKIEDRMAARFDELAKAISTLDIKQERGFGFFAGISFVVVACGAVIIGAIKLFSGG